MELSIIIPAYNMQGCIAACLRSVTRCPRENIDMECLVVDAGSEDETAAIVKRYIERDRRIRLISGRKGGIADAHNRGVEEALGKYIMFLETDVRLCEDAWEQIEAAVEEMYADFVVFSYIEVRGKGKFKARMLPISDVISTDEWEARRLLYADSAFNACWGKLFRSDIIKDNHIAFRPELLVGADSLFVAEYFGYCGSILMTKAMIVYCLQSGKNAACDYSIKERLDSMYVLYEFEKNAAAAYNDSELVNNLQSYYVKVLGNLLCAYAKKYRRDKGTFMEICKEALSHKAVHEILDGADRAAMPSMSGKYECGLLKKMETDKISRYFLLKAYFFHS